MLLSLDLGTTHFKAGLFSPDGRQLAVKSRPHASQEKAGWGLVYDPEAAWQMALALAGEVLRAHPGTVQALGITGMAETGLLVEPRTGEPRTPLLPWFNRQAAASVVDQLRGELDRQAERFACTGIWPSLKTSLAKLLWLRQTRPQLLPGSLWLSLPDYIAYRLTGRFASEPSLAGRTYLYRIDQQRWDQEWLDFLGLAEVRFPPVLPSGSPVGEVTREVGEKIGLQPGVPVCISGHDHICAAFGVQALMRGELSALQPDQVFDSMGTAETLTGTLPEAPPGQPLLGEVAYQSGLSFGCQAAPGAYYWLGGLSASGGSLEWLRSILGEPRLAYADLEALSETILYAPPSGILYFPYLAGRGSPHTAPHARAAFLGLDAAHTRADLLQAVLEGTALEIEFIRRTAQEFLGAPIRQLTAAGGSTGLRAWMQIKANVSGLPVLVPAVEQGALLGAALLAGQGSGLFGSNHRLHQPVQTVYEPNLEHSELYSEIFDRFVGLQAAVQQYSPWRAE
jgi:sugar (pentulose or hexulose) kinase